MIVHRTTKGFLASHCARRRFLFGLVLCALLWAPPGVGIEFVDDQLRVSLSGLPMAPQWPPDLLIQGVWPDSCPPVIVRSSLADSHIDIVLRRSSNHCSDVPTPLSLRINPAREAGLRQLGLGVFQIRLHLLGDDGSSQLLGFRLLQSGGTDTSSRPESGFWWSVPTDSQVPALAGSGVSIEQQGENLAVTLLTYEAGAPVWYFGSTTMPGSIAHLPLLRMVGGDEPFSGPGASPRAETGMSLNLQFMGPAHAQAWLVRPRRGAEQAVEVQELNLLRIPFQTDRIGAGWRGLWALVADDAREARVIELTDLLTADAESFRLRDRSGELTLQCRLDDIGGHPTPAFCSLNEADGVVADFDRIGLDRLSGLTTEGRPVRLVRLPD